MPFAKVDGVELCYEVQGQGPRLLFVNGTGSDLRVKPNIFDSPLASAFELLAYDHSGLGRSTTPAGPSTMSDFANQAVLLMAHVGWGSAAVIGVSFGGMVAQEIALRHPDKVDALVLACTSSGGAGGSSYPLHELQELPIEERLERSIVISDVRHDDAWTRENARVLAPFLSAQAAQLRAVESDPERARGQLLQLRARRQHDTWDRLGQISCPTLIQAGRYDGLAPVANSQNLAGAIPGAVLEVYEGGHGFLLEDPKAFPAAVEFLLAHVA